MLKAGKNHRTLNQNQINYILANYIESNGEIYRYNKSADVFQKAKEYNNGRYLYVRINKKSINLNMNYSSHKLVWLINYKSEPNGNVDHIDTDKLNNKIDNLRLCSVSQNRRNMGITKTSTSGAKGVYKNNSGYIVQLKLENGKTKTIGRFTDLSAAAKAFNVACHRHLSPEALEFQQLNIIA